MVRSARPRIQEHIGGLDISVYQPGGMSGI
jgi:hypothetical protein